MQTHWLTRHTNTSTRVLTTHSFTRHTDWQCTHIDSPCRHTDSPDTDSPCRHTDSPDTLDHQILTNHADTLTHHADTLTHQTHWLTRHYFCWHVPWWRYISHFTRHVSYVILTVAGHDDVTVRHRIGISTAWGQRQTDVGRRLWWRGHRRWWRGHRRWWRGHRRWWRGDADVCVAAGSDLASVVDVGTGGRALLPPVRPCRVVVPGATWRHVTQGGWRGGGGQNVLNKKVSPPPPVKLMGKQ